MTCGVVRYCDNDNRGPLLRGLLFAFGASEEGRCCEVLKKRSKLQPEIVVGSECSAEKPSQRWRSVSWR